MTCAGQPLRRLVSPSAPVLSVVMPVFNVARYLDAAIKSVLTQDFADLELILVDDGSTDDGREIIDKHQQLDPRVRVIALGHNTLGGAGIPSNLGIKAARGKYLGFVDSDDLVTKTAFRRMLLLAEEHSSDVVVGDFRIFGDKRGVVAAYDSAIWSDIPTGRVISTATDPALLRLSPVPWRKLYRRQFLEEHQILYPEGDYFYEDNPLHWRVLSRAQRVVACDQVVVYHRMDREGQTMGSQAFRLGAMAIHANTILNALTEITDGHRELLFAEFFAYLYRLQWVVNRQTQGAAALIQRALAEVAAKAIAVAPGVPLSAEITSRLSAYKAAYPDVDLTVVIAVRNDADLIRASLDPVMKLTGLRFNVLLVEHGSEDASLTVMQEYEEQYENVHVFTQGDHGAGRACNSVIPLCTGRFTYFLDPGVIIDPRMLQLAVEKADHETLDLLFAKHRVELVDEHRIEGMAPRDVEIWDQLRAAQDQQGRRKYVADLTTKPWNRLIRTSLLHDACIFFGPLKHGGDVLFHWNSTLSARNIGYLDADMCVHRELQVPDQLKDSGTDILETLDVLRYTHRCISELNTYSSVRDEWAQFVRDQLEWAKDRGPEFRQEAYRAISEELIGAVSAS